MYWKEKRVIESQGTGLKPKNEQKQRRQKNLKENKWEEKIRRQYMAVG